MRVEDVLKLMLTEAGACAVGIAEAGPVPEKVRNAYDEWLSAGMAAGMVYLHNNKDLRFDPRLLLEGCRSLICLAFSYVSELKNNYGGEGEDENRRGDGNNYGGEGGDEQYKKEGGEGYGRGAVPISEYALVPDYHVWVKRRIRESGIGRLLGEENKDWRICVDSAPVSERYWAWKAGLGIIGDNGMLIVPGVGSRVFLAEILTNKELEADLPKNGDCGHCGSCKRVCPAGALGKTKAGGMAGALVKTEATGMAGEIDCNLCLSYLTIEHRGEWVDERHRQAMATAAGRNTLFGCDRCVEVCPHNRVATVKCVEQTLQDLEHITAEGILSGTRLPKESCLRRAGRKGLLRNAANMLGHKL